MFAELAAQQLRNTAAEWTPICSGAYSGPSTEAESRWNANEELLCLRRDGQKVRLPALDTCRVAAQPLPEQVTLACPLATSSAEAADAEPTCAEEFEMLGELLGMAADGVPVHWPVGWDLLRAKSALEHHWQQQQRQLQPQQGGTLRQLQ